MAAIRISKDPQKLQTNDPFQYGFLSLPNETLHEILSYFPEIDPTIPRGNYDPSNVSHAYVRSDALRSLSQACRAFRKIFLPLLWQRFDVYSRKSEGVWFKQVSRVLEAKSKGLARSNNKELAGYVRSCHVVLTRCAKSTTIPAFARCLALLPNLRTIEILHAHSQMTTAFKNSFEGISLPSIHTAILSSCAHNILRCCPEVRYVTCTEENGSKLVSAIAQCCPKVEGLHGIIPDVALMKRIVKLLPNLRHLTLKCISLSAEPGYMSFPTKSIFNPRITTPPQDLITHLRPLKKLTTLKFTLRERDIDSPNVSPCVKAARAVLRETESDLNAKRLVVQLVTQDLLYVGEDI